MVRRTVTRARRSRGSPTSSTGLAAASNLDSVAGGEPLVCLSCSLIGGGRPVALQHLAGSPAGQPHQVTLRPALGQPLVGERVPELVRVHTVDAGLEASAGDQSAGCATASSRAGSSRRATGAGRRPACGGRGRAGSGRGLGRSWRRTGRRRPRRPLPVTCATWWTRDRDRPLIGPPARPGASRCRGTCA